MEVAGLALVGGSSLYVLNQVAKRFFPVTVNCWFCNQDTKVEFQDRNRWNCPYCEQYNGFNTDGDYNAEITKNQYENKKFCVRATKKAAQTGNGLCEACNMNQDLKVHQLKAFVPKNPQKYDQEVEEFAEHLDRVYKLCRYCKFLHK